VGGKDIKHDRRTGWLRIWKECGSWFVLMDDYTSDHRGTKCRQKLWGRFLAESLRMRKV
jgi:hypothetical protein